jgi:hypothetical protein
MQPGDSQPEFCGDGFRIFVTLYTNEIAPNFQARDHRKQAKDRTTTSLKNSACRLSVTWRKPLETSVNYATGQLLALNREVAAKIEKGEPVTAPGVPKHYPDANKLVTEDCIRPGTYHVWRGCHQHAGATRTMAGRGASDS